LEELNVDRGAVSIGHPYCMSGVRDGHTLIEGKRRGAKYVVVTINVGAGNGRRAAVRGDVTPLSGGRT
jgi:acetyl-CoA C-acetyltransferase